MKKFLSLLSRKTKLKCMGIIVLAMVNAFLSSIWPVRLNDLYTSISSGNVLSLKQGLVLIAQFGIIYLSAECISIARRVLLDCIIASHEAETRSRSIEKLLKMPVAYCAGRLNAERTAQLNQGGAGLSQMIKSVCNDVFATVLTAICTLAQVLLNTHWIMCFIMMLHLIFTVTISYFQIRSQNGIREKIVAQKTALDGHISESISNLEFIRGMNAETYERKRLYPSILQVSHTEKEHHCCMGRYDCLKQVCKITFQMAILVAAIIITLSGRMAAGAVITSCLLFQQLVKPINEVYRFMDETASSVVKAKTLLEVMTSPQDELFDAVGCDELPVDNTITLENVIISNPCNNPEKAKPLAWYDRLIIPTNCKVALQGPNGCRKTTILRAIKRFYPCTQGTVRLFGKPLELYTPQELTDYICYVPQSTLFFSGSIRDNLTYGLNIEATDEQLLDALAKASLLDELIHAKGAEPDVLSIRIAEGGKSFSGGQRQRLALARAFLRTPKLYLLDESTSNLDAAAIDSVLANVEKHAAEHHAGIVYISHDKRVMNHCDQIIQVVNLLNAQSSEPSAMPMASRYSNAHLNNDLRAKGVCIMTILTSAAHPHHDHSKEMKPMFDPCLHHTRPISPHERKALMRVEFDDNNWTILQEVFGDADSAAAAASIILNSPPEIQILSAQIINMIQKEAA